VSSADGAPRIPRGGLDPVAGSWRRVSRKYLWVDLIGTLIGGIVVTAASAVPWVLTGGPGAPGGLGLFVIAPIVVGVIVLISVIITPRRVRSIGYLLRDDDLVVRRGILFQRFVAVPYGRMQLVDVTRGPIERALGLSQLKLVTAAAASNVTIPGLPEADAESLRDHLVQLAETRRAGL
jgi:uncharacterized protein